MNNFLKTRQEVEDASKYLADNGLIASGLSCKNWEIAQVIPYLKNGRLLDMGSDGSVVLENAVKLNLHGRKVGVDLAYKENRFTHEGLELYKMDLMETVFNDGSFDTITSLSVIEHEVNFEKFANEVSRLLRSGGKLYCSFDYWQPKPDYEKRKLYSLDWNILDKADVINLVTHLARCNLAATGEIDWTTQDAVINSTFCSPVSEVSYTFGILEFIKI